MSTSLSSFTGSQHIKERSMNPSMQSSSPSDTFCLSCYKSGKVSFSSKVKNFFKNWVTMSFQLKTDPGKRLVCQVKARPSKDLENSMSLSHGHRNELSRHPCTSLYALQHSQPCHHIWEKLEVCSWQDKASQPSLLDKETSCRCKCERLEKLGALKKEI